MYTRYVRGPDGFYRRSVEPETAAAPPPAPEAAKKTPDAPEPPLPPRPAPPSKPARTFAADDLLLAAIVGLLLLDGGEDETVAVLAALAFLLF